MNRAQIHTDRRDKFDVDARLLGGCSGPNQLTLGHGFAVRVIQSGRETRCVCRPVQRPLEIVRENLPWVRAEWLRRGLSRNQNVTTIARGRHFDASARRRFIPVLDME